MAQREVWLREPAVTLDPLRHLLLCTLEQAREEIAAAAFGLSDEQVWSRPYGLSPLGFHIRHIAGSIDRLLTYAEAREISEEQLAVLKAELSDAQPLATLLAGLNACLAESRNRIEALDASTLADTRHIGRARIATPLGTLLAHTAEHTSRHMGQIATTSKLLRAL